MNITQQIKDAEARIEALDMDQLDGANMLDVMMHVAASHEMSLKEFLTDNPHDLVSNILQATQSNPTQARSLLQQWAELEELIDDLTTILYHEPYPSHML